MTKTGTRRESSDFCLARSQIIEVCASQSCRKRVILSKIEARVYGNTTKRKCVFMPRMPPSSPSFRALGATRPSTPGLRKRGVSSRVIHWRPLRTPSGKSLRKKQKQTGWGRRSAGVPARLEEISTRDDLRPPALPSVLTMTGHQEWGRLPDCYHVLRVKATVEATAAANFGERQSPRTSGTSRNS